MRPLKQNKNIGYSSRFEGGVPIFLIGNHVLRKTINKFFKNFFFQIRKKTLKWHICNILNVGRCLTVNKKIFYPTLMQMTMQYLQCCKTLKNRKIFSKKTVVESKFPAISLLNMFVFGKFTYILKKEMPLYLPILKTKFRCFFEKSSFLRGRLIK